MIIIVQSDNLSDLFKDFAAMTFISVMDNIAFITVLEGLLGHDLRATARKVTKLKVCEHEDKGVYSIKWVILVLTLLIMSVTLVTFSGMQSMGYFLPISLTLQVGDEENFLMQAHNGVYKRTKVKHHRRYIYEEANSNGGKKGHMVYCGNFWGYALLTENLDENWEQNCRNKLSMYSPDTDGFDISSVPTNGWKIEKGHEMVSLSSLKIIVNDCRDDSYCGIPLGEVYSGV